MERIRTERLELRNFVPEDYRDLKEIIIDKEASDYAVYDHEFPTGEEAVRRVTERFANGDKFMAVWLPEAAKVIGFVCLNGEDRKLDLGYCFHSKFGGKGYATEACRAVLRHAFHTLNVDSLESGTALLNEPSCRMLDRLGFEKTGEERLAFRKTAEGIPIEFVGGTYLLEKERWMGLQSHIGE
jgi:RimJ/RimL family protein N-acetyltransferase